MAKIYLHGHHDSVLRSHRWRTAENSAGYLLAHLHEDAQVPDVGCGPGGLIAARDGDYGGMFWFPEEPELAEWLALHRAVARALGGEPDAEPGGPGAAGPGLAALGRHPGRVVLHPARRDRVPPLAA
jgi:hypothetical protein